MTIDGILDALHIGLYWDTMREIKRLRKIKEDYKRLNELERFLNRVKNKVPIEENNQEPMKGELDWEKIYSRLWYYSDRWCLSRACNLMYFVEKERMKRLMDGIGYDD